MPTRSFWKGRRVLVTGHTGFKGCWLLLWLEQLGADVWGYALDPTNQPNLFDELYRKHSKGYSWHHCAEDLANLKALKSYVKRAEPEVVIHLAAQALVRQSYIDPLGTWATNVQGSLNLLESLREIENTCAVVMVTTDKVYKNREWNYGYRETDRLGGHDPYSASKAAAEIAVSSWRDSFCGEGLYQNPHLRIATARAGNVIGGGDWSVDRIVPDAIRALKTGGKIAVRNQAATRPWQHVLEPLCGYLQLAEALISDPVPPTEAFNFGPHLESNRPVSELVHTILEIWPGEWIDQADKQAPHEAGLLHLANDKAKHRLGWQPRWNYETTIRRTVDWYRSVHEGLQPIDCCLGDIDAYQAIKNTPQFCEQL